MIERTLGFPEKKYIIYKNNKFYYYKYIIFILVIFWKILLRACTKNRFKRKPSLISEEAMYNNADIHNITINDQFWTSFPEFSTN